MEKTLYAWQEECLRRWLANNGRGTVQAVTGSGKTLLALTAAGYLQRRIDRPLLIKIVVPTTALMSQWAQAIRKAISRSVLTPGPIGLMGGGRGSSHCLPMQHLPYRSLICRRGKERIHGAV